MTKKFEVNVTVSVDATYGFTDDVTIWATDKAEARSVARHLYHPDTVVYFDSVQEVA